MNGEFVVVRQPNGVCLVEDFSFLFLIFVQTCGILLFVSLVAGWVTHDFWREDDWCLLPIICQFLQPSGTYSSCGFCCLYLKTQQYFAIVGQQMWKYSLRNFRTNSEHYGFANFVCFPCMFYCFPVKSSCQLEVASLRVVKCIQCVYCLVSWYLSVYDRPEQAQVPTCWFWCLFQALQLNFSLSPHVERCVCIYIDVF